MESTAPGIEVKSLCVIPQLVAQESFPEEDKAKIGKMHSKD